MAVAESLQIIVDAKVNEAISGLKKVESSSSKLTTTLKKLAGPVAIGAVVIATVRMAKESLRAFGIQEEAEARLKQTIISTGEAAGLTADQLIDMAKGLQEVTKFGDEAIIGAESLLLTFKDIGGDVFPRALESILDVSEAMGTGLKESTVQLGKALNDPIGGISALTRVGIQFTDQQKETIKSMVEMNDVSGAQGIILDELESQFGGVARAAADTASGSFVQMSNASGDLKESLGAIVSSGLHPFAEALTPIITDLADFISLQVTANQVMNDLKDGTLNADVNLEELGVTLTKLNRNLKGAKSLGAPVETIEAQIRAVQGLIDAYGIQDTFLIQANDRSRIATQLQEESNSQKESSVAIIKEVVTETENEVLAIIDLQALLIAVDEQKEAGYKKSLSGLATVTEATADQSKAVKQLEIDYQALANNGMSAFAIAFKQIGTDGVSAWDVVKQAGKDAMSAVLEGLAQEALARAAFSLVPGLTFNPAAAVGYAAAAAGAYAASGAVQSLATGGSFVANQATPLLVGEGGGSERVTVEPIGGGSSGGGSMILNIDGTQFQGWLQDKIDNGGIRVPRRNVV